MNQRVPFEQRSRSLRSWHQRAQAFRLRGLTTHGKPRQRNDYRTADERIAAAQRHNRDKATRRSLRHQLAGLTSRGTPRVYHLTKFDRVVLESDFDALAATLAECFESLPPKAQAKAVELATRLAELKRRFK